MKKDTLNLIAIDCGNSSIRTTLGRFDGERFSTELISRTEQREVLLNGLYYWDLPFIVQQIKKVSQGGRHMRAYRQRRDLDLGY